MCSFVAKQGKCYLHSRRKGWGGLQLWRELLGVNRRGVMSELLLFWMILFSLGGGGVVSVWSAGWEHLWFLGSSRIPLRVLLSTRLLMLGNIAPTSAQTWTIICNWLVFLSEQILKLPPDLVNPWRLLIHLSHEHKHLKFCLQVVYQQKYQFQNEDQKSCLWKQSSPRNISELQHSLLALFDNVCMTNVNAILTLYTEMQIGAYLGSLVPVQHLLWTGFTQCMCLCSPGELNACVHSSAAAVSFSLFSVLLLIRLEGQHSGKIQADVIHFPLCNFFSPLTSFWPLKREVSSLCIQRRIFKSLLV